MSTLVKYKKFDESKHIYIPTYKTAGSSGMDIMSIENIDILPGDTALISTNLTVEIPEGYEIQVRPRSGLAAKHSITVLNTPGTIDSDYRGEIKVILYNAGKQTFSVMDGDRIAQIVLAKVEKIHFLENFELTETERNAGGFGSTGIK